MMTEIIEYIKQKYEPLSVIVYGSFADGSNNQNSDFDALVISRNEEVFHDNSFVDGVQLDVFVYPSKHFDGDFDCGDFVQIFDGNIVLDTDNIGQLLKDRVLSYISKRQSKNHTEIKSEVEWCRKMLLRTDRNDAEGMFRWHWVLIDSLEIFSDIVHHAYFGPKKTLRWMETDFPEAFECYKNALFNFSRESLESWILYLEKQYFER